MRDEAKTRKAAKGYVGCHLASMQKQVRILCGLSMTSVRRAHNIVLVFTQAISSK